jgi:uncharacterized protein YjbJ (UPF0337 family)
MRRSHDKQEHRQSKGSREGGTGALGGDKRLKNKGRVDQAKGSAKKTVDKVADTLTGNKRA